MAKKGSWNPIAFRPVQVTLIASAVYIALFAVLLWIHLIVPPAPSSPTPKEGINLTQAWLDLDAITAQPHPFNSRNNEVVREILVDRIEDILKHNGADYKVETTSTSSKSTKDGSGGPRNVTVIRDLSSNATFVDRFRQVPWTFYHESANIMVYVRGSQDSQGDWWHRNETYDGQGGVLVNAHYDSVPTAYGATDDGVGTVTVLQLISYFTTRGRQPKRGIVMLLNDAEEDGLNGAYAFLRHPLSQLPRTFLNLEGAGAGGRATLFRSTDAQVTDFYSHSRRPFGTVLSGDGFKRGFIKSGTDYSVFADTAGMRGLDVAFFEPRSRYHTDEDDARDTSVDSLWHMLSASLETVERLANHKGNEFEGTFDDNHRLNTKKGDSGVWFDLLGRGFVVMNLPTLFGLSVALLVVAPIVLIALEALLVKLDKWYPFTRTQYLHGSDDDEAIQISGLRGFFRFPVVFVVSTAAVVALAYLMAKVNPYILYSSEYSVWAMMLTAWFVVAWFFFSMADQVRPTALSRFHVLLWMYILSWILLVLATVGENNFQIASGYLLVFYNLSMFAALLVGYVEFFALPTRTKYVEHVADAIPSSRRGSISSRRLLEQADERPSSSRAADGDEEEATERTSLLRGGESRSRSRRKGTFLGFAKRRMPETDAELDEETDPLRSKAYGDEQAWSGSLPQSTWLVQFLFVAPMNLLLLGQIALLLTSALHQTPADGNPVLPIYMIFAALTVLLLLPLAPFVHRFKHQVPTVLLLIFAGCLIYNLLAFPFSRDARLKILWNQHLNLTSGENYVQVISLDGYAQSFVEAIPSSSGQAVECKQSKTKLGLVDCSWPGLAPLVTAYSTSEARNSTQHASPYIDWVSFNTTSRANTALFSLRGQNSKLCSIDFETPVSRIAVAGASSDARFPGIAEGGSSRVKLYGRDAGKTFLVNVTWDGQTAANQRGQIACFWEDHNEGQMPAFDETQRFAPVWSTFVRGTDGLLRGFKDFQI